MSQESINFPSIIHLNQLGKYCFPTSLLKDINELSQMLYVFRHLQNSIFEHLKYTQCYIDLNKFKNSLLSFELFKNRQNVLKVTPFYGNSKEISYSQVINLNHKLIQGKIPTCVLNICQWLTSKNDKEKYALERLKLYGKSLVYRLLCLEKLDNPLVFTIIRNLGMHVNEELRQIAFATIRRDVREVLLIHLEHIGRIKEEEKENIEFIRKLEKQLPNPSYSSAKQKNWFLNLRKSYSIHSNKGNKILFIFFIFLLR